MCDVESKAYQSHQAIAASFSRSSAVCQGTSSSGIDRQPYAWWNVWRFVDDVFYETMCFALRVMHNSIATEISVSLDHKNLASDDQD